MIYNTKNRVSFTDLSIAWGTGTLDPAQRYKTVGSGHAHTQSDPHGTQ